MLFHEWIRAQLRKERTMKDIADHDMFGLPEAQTQCAFCQRFVPLVTATKSKFEITSTRTEEEHFCGDECAEGWWDLSHGSGE